MLLTTRQNTKLRNAINNNLTIDVKLSKAQIKKLIQSGGFLGKLLSKLAGPLIKVALPLTKNVLAPLGLTAAMPAIDGSIQKKIHGSGVELTIEEEDMKDIMKIIEALENPGILLKGVSKTIENETKEQRGGFLSMLLGTLGVSLLGNLLTGRKGMMRAGEGSVSSRAKGEEIVHAGEGSKKNNLNSLLPFHPLTNIEINEYYKNEPKFNGVYSSSLECIKSNVFRIQAYDSIMCGYFCIEFINYMLKGKTLLDYTNLFSPNDFKKNDRIIKRIFKNE